MKSWGQEAENECFTIIQSFENILGLSSKATRRVKTLIASKDYALHKDVILY